MLVIFAINSWHIYCFVFRKNATDCGKNNKGESMKFTKLQMVVPALMIISVFGLTPSRALAKQEGKTKVKSTEKTATKENSGRQAGELPSGLQKYTEKKGQLPSGLQKIKDEDGHLTKGLENGGKKLQSNAKSNKPSK
jgi:hypothetical protein